MGYKQYIDYEVHYLEGKVFGIKKSGEKKEIIGYDNGHGYLTFSYQGKTTKKHRFIYEQFYNIKLGPKQQINHIDLNKQNNSISNLEVVTNQQNSMHKNKRVDNTSGHKNIYWREDMKKWHIQVKHNGKFVLSEFRVNLENAKFLRDIFIIGYNIKYKTRYLISD